MENSDTFAATRKRRRSSLFVDRRSRVYEEIDESHGGTSNDPIVDKKGENDAAALEYISKTKQTYKNWKAYEKEVKSKLEATRNAKPLQCDEKLLMQSLCMEDRAFLKEAEEFVQRRSELTKELPPLRSAVEALAEQYEFNKQLVDIAYDNLTLLYQTTVARVVDEHERSAEQKFGKFPISSEFPVVRNAMPELDYITDSE